MIGPSGEEAILTTEEDLGFENLQIDEDLTEGQIVEDYQIDETSQWIKGHEFKIVGLQFPDQLLPISVPIFKSLRSRCPSEVELYLMADTSYGSCCVDEVAAQHVNAQAIIHYGNACMNTTSQLPVFYVLPRLAISDETIRLVTDQLVESFSRCLPPSDRQSEPQRVFLMYDVGFHWKIAQVATSLSGRSNLIITVEEVETKQDKISRNPERSVTSSGSDASTSTDCQKYCQTSDSICGTGSSCCMSSNKMEPHSSIAATASSSEKAPSRPLQLRTEFSEFQAVFYIGGESRRLTHFLVTNPNLPVFAIDPSNRSIRHSNCCKLQTERTNKLLMRRYATIQRARDSDVFGILVGTLGISNYLELIDRTKQLIEKKFGKKSYMVSVGKLKPEKLINFPEIECWVLIDCPENSLLLLDHQNGGRYDPKEYRIPIITPWELEVALSSCNEEEIFSGEKQTGRIWEGRLVLDFERLLDAWKSDKTFEGIDNKEPGAEEVPQPNSADIDAPVFSTVTGTYKYRRNWNNNGAAPQELTAEQQLALKDSKSELIEYLGGAASNFALNQRTFQGLDPRIGLDEPSKVEIGRSGIAQGYGDDHPFESNERDEAA